MRLTWGTNLVTLDSNWLRSTASWLEPLELEPFYYLHQEDYFFFGLVCLSAGLQKNYRPHFLWRSGDGVWVKEEPIKFQSGSNTIYFSFLQNEYYWVAGLALQSGSGDQLWSGELDNKWRGGMDTQLFILYETNWADRHSNGTWMVRFEPIVCPHTLP